MPTRNQYEALYERQFADVPLPLQKQHFVWLRSIFRSSDITPLEVCLDLLPEGHTLAEIGCGDGEMLEALAPRYRRLIGFEVAPSRLKRAQKRLSASPSVDLRIANVDDGIPLESGTADVTLCMAVIEHVFNVYGLVDELFRITKPGGIGLFQVPNVGYIRHRLTFLRGNLPLTSDLGYSREAGWDGGHLHYFTRKMFSKLLTDCGWNIERVTGTGFFAKYRNWYPALLTGDLIMLVRKPR
jgi:SAM-dependent methyltransferase